MSSKKKHDLDGGFNPFEKYARQIGAFPQEGVKIKKKWNHHLVIDTPLNPSWLSLSNSHAARVTASRSLPKATSKASKDLRSTVTSDEFLRHLRNPRVRTAGPPKTNQDLPLKKNAGWKTFPFEMLPFLRWHSFILGRIDIEIWNFRSGRRISNKRCVSNPIWKVRNLSASPWVTTGRSWGVLRSLVGNAKARKGT